MTLIKLVVPTLNSHLLLSKLIESLQSQSFPHWNILFIDGKSTQQHRKWLNECCIKEKRCKWIQQSNYNSGIFGAMNEGFIKANKQEWLLFWGSDDWAARPDVFEKFIEVITSLKKPYPDLIVCNGRYIKKSSNILKRRTSFIRTKKNIVLSAKSFRRKLFFGSTPPHQATFFGPGARYKLDKYSEKLKLAADLDYFLKLSESKELKVLNIDLELVHISDAGISGIQTNKRLKEVVLTYQKHFNYFWWFPFLIRYIKKLSSLINYSL